MCPLPGIQAGNVKRRGKRVVWVVRLGAAWRRGKMRAVTGGGGSDGFDRVTGTLDPQSQLHLREIRSGHATVLVVCCAPGLPDRRKTPVCFRRF